MDSKEATDLWRQFAEAGDTSAFDRLYRAYRVRVMRYCRARLRNEEAADDVTDRTFTYLFMAKRYFHEMTLDEITGVLQATRSKIKTRCRKALRKTDRKFDSAGGGGAGPGVGGLRIKLSLSNGFVS